MDGAAERDSRRYIGRSREHHKVTFFCAAADLDYRTLDWIQTTGSSSTGLYIFLFLEVLKLPRLMHEKRCARMSLSRRATDSYRPYANAGSTERCLKRILT